MDDKMTDITQGLSGHRFWHEEATGMGVLVAREQGEAGTGVRLLARSCLPPSDAPSLTLSTDREI